MSLVLDGSVALAWCLADETSGQADIVLSLLEGKGAVVPAHWELEVVNGLMAAERHGLIGASDTDRLSRLLGLLPIEVEPPVRGERLRMTHRLASQHGISGYDAAYLELALRKGSQLITMDQALSAAARKEGVGG